MEEEAEVEVASLLEEDIHIAEVEEVPLADLSVEEGADSPYYLNKGIKKAVPLLLARQRSGAERRPAWIHRHQK